MVCRSGDPPAGSMHASSRRKTTPVMQRRLQTEFATLRTHWYMLGRALPPRPDRCFLTANCHLEYERFGRRGKYQDIRKNHTSYVRGSLLCGRRPSASGSAGGCLLTAGPGDDRACGVRKASRASRGRPARRRASGGRSHTTSSSPSERPSAGPHAYFTGPHAK